MSFVKFFRYAAIVFLIQLISSSAFAASQVLRSDTVATVEGYKGSGDRVSAITVSSRSFRFKQALRVVRKSQAEFSYSAALIWKSARAVKKDDLLVARFYVRKIAAQQPLLKLEATFQLNDEPFTPLLFTNLPVDTGTFQYFALPFRADRDYAAGSTSLQIRYGLVPQTFDIGGVEVINYGKVGSPIPKSVSATFAAYYPGRNDTDASWRKKAQQNIERYRKGNMTVRVVDAAGRPLRNTSVKIEQLESNFVWASAASAISLTCSAGQPGDSNQFCPTKDQLNNKPVTRADYVRLRKELLLNFNASSFYNDLKWPEWRSNEALALAGIAWMKRSGITFYRGHNLIWPGYTPDYLMPVEIINASTSPEESRRVIEEHFRQILGKLKGKVPEWDVVNEPYSVYDVQGRITAPGTKAVAGKLPASVVADWFKIARAADPSIKLFLNDYAILENLNPAAQRYDLALLKYIEGFGARVDGIGFQAHFNSAGPVFSEMQRVIDEFSPLVERFAVSEYDFTSLDPAFQADLTRDFMTFIFGQPKFKSFQMWGFWDGDHWLGSAPLYDHDWRLKASGKVWQQLTQQTWRTSATGISNTRGESTFRAFYGRYRISVTRNGKTCKTFVQFDTTGTTTAQGSC
jgi:endo-1,4-beta-xylanase